MLNRFKHFYSEKCLSSQKSFTQKALYQHLAILKLQNFYFRSFSAFESKIFSFTQNSFRFMFSPQTFFLLISWFRCCCYPKENDENVSHHSEQHIMRKKKNCVWYCEQNFLWISCSLNWIGWREGRSFNLLIFNMLHVDSANEADQTQSVNWK